MIKGRKISLYKVEQSHLEPIYKILMKDGIGCTFSTTYKELSFSELYSWLLLTEPGTSSKAFSITYKDKIVGFLTLNNIHPIRHNAYIGVVGVDPDIKENLLGLDALRTIIDYGFNSLNLHRMYGHTFSDNPKMSTIYKRGGWKLEGVEREYTFNSGKWIDKQIWGILRKEYKGR